MERVANVELRNFYFLPNPYSWDYQVNEETICWGGGGEVRDVIKPYKILVRKPEGQTLLDK
jgi:hypothetical protein